MAAAMVEERNTRGGRGGAEGEEDVGWDDLVRRVLVAVLRKSYGSGLEVGHCPHSFSFALLTY